MNRNNGILVYNLRYAYNGTTSHSLIGSKLYVPSELIQAAARSSETYDT